MHFLGIYIAFFNPEREESLKVAFFSFTDDKIEVIQEFDIWKDPALEVKWCTEGIKDVKLVKIEKAIFMIIARGSKSSLALKVLTQGTDTSLKLHAILKTPANKVQISKSRWGTFINLLDSTSSTAYSYSRGSFVRGGEV